MCFFHIFQSKHIETFDRRGAILVKGVHEIMLKKPSETGIKTWNFSFISGWRHCKIVYIHSIQKDCILYKIQCLSLGDPWVILWKRVYFDLILNQPPLKGEWERRSWEEKDGIRRKNTSKRNNSQERREDKREKIKQNEKKQTKKA